MTPPFLNKDPEIPDNYGVKIFFHSGRVLELELATHGFADLIRVFSTAEETKGKFDFAPAPSPYFEYATLDDIWGRIPYSSIERMEFDKRYSKLVALQEKKIASQNKQK